MDIFEILLTELDLKMTFICLVEASKFSIPFNAHQDNGSHGQSNFVDINNS